MNDLVFLPAHQLAKVITEGSISAEEVLEAYLAQINKHNPTLNAIITLDEQGARRRAKEADAAFSRGEILGSLHGVPVTIKDSFQTAGLLTTSSYPPLANYIPSQDATVVARLRAAGAVILGKTNLPRLSTGIQTNSPLFGRTNNPWNHSYTSGGSTGGGAAAVAAGMSALEIGSDIGGSLRIPAHFCGVFGLQPTIHRVPSSGKIPQLPGRPRSLRLLGVVGPLARSVEDLQLCLSIIEGPDGQQWEVPAPPKESIEQPPLQQYRFAWTDTFGDFPVTEETRGVLKNLASKLSALGCQVERQNPSNFNFEEAFETYAQITATELYGRESPAKLFLWRMLSVVPSGLIPGGVFVRGLFRGINMSMQQYMESLTQRDQFIAAMEQFLSNWDAWLCPVCLGAAFTHRRAGQPLEVDGKKVSYWMAVAYTAIFNLTGNPVVVIPVGYSHQGLPIGVQVVGRRWRDIDLLNVSQKLAEVVGSFRRPSNY
jgi:amidase